MTHLEAYYDLIKRREIVVGYWIRREVENLIRDLDNPRYIYETTEADKRIAFIEKFCVQSKKPYYGQKIKLMPWQKMIEEVIYSYRFSETSARRFIKLLLVIARKNGKSSFLASDEFYDLMAGEGGTQIANASNDDAQARLIWDDVNFMRQNFDPHDKITSNNLTVIRNDRKNIKIWRRSSLTKYKDGDVLTKACLDEAHDIDEPEGNSEIEDALWRSMSSQDDPLLEICTTQGFSREGCFLDVNIDKAQKVIEGVVDDERFLPFLFMQDSEVEIWQDESSWEKSNPALRYGVKKIDKLRCDVEEAKTNRAKRGKLLTKDFNIKSNQAKAWLDIDSITYEQQKHTMEDFRGAVALGAFDGSQTTDLTNFKFLVMRPNDPTKYIFSHYWIPESKLTDSDDRNAGAEYEKWAAEGYVTITPGTIIDQTDVVRYVDEVFKLYGIKLFKCGYDKNYAREFEKGMITLKEDLLEVINTKLMSLPMKWLERDLERHLVNFSNNPVDTWCLKNAGCKIDAHENYACVKFSKPKRIDGTIVLIILYATLMRYQSEYMKIIESN